MHTLEPEALLVDWRKYDLPFKDQPKLIKRFISAGGNQSFLVSADGGQWVVRLNRGADQLGVDREREQVIHQHAADAGLAPAIKFHSGDGLILITQYVLGQNFSPVGLNENTINALLQSVSEIHALKLNLPDFDYRGHLALLASETELDDSLSDALDIVESSSPRAVCHHDLTPENILLTHRGPVFIDWEYAGLGFAAMDFATIICDGQVPLDEVSARTGTAKELLSAACLVYQTMCEMWSHKNSLSATG